MRERFRSFDSKISFFAFADIITAVSGMLIFITLLLATDLGRPTDRSSAANAEMEKQLQDTLRQEAQVDAENRGLQQLLTTANTAPVADKLESDISRLRTELATEKSKHAGMAEDLAASKSALDEQDKLLGIAAVRQHIQDGATELTVLEREDEKVRDETAALEQKIRGVEVKIVKLRSREGQIWLMPDRSQTTKEPILAVVSGRGVEIERFNRPDLGRQFDKSGALAGFEAYLRGVKETQQYIVFLIRPSGIAVFKDLVKVARKKNFEVGFDALEENREIHFTAPPPIDDQEIPGKKPEYTVGPSGTPGPTSGRGDATSGNETAGGPGGGAPAGGPGNGTEGTNMTSGTDVKSGTDTGSGTNAVSGANGTNGTSGTNMTPGGSATSGSNTNAPTPPPPKPKSWWRRFLEWIGVG